MVASAAALRVSCHLVNSAAASSEAASRPIATKYDETTPRPRSNTVSSVSSAAAALGAAGGGVQLAVNFPGLKMDFGKRDSDKIYRVGCLCMHTCRSRFLVCQ